MDSYNNKNNYDEFENQTHEVEANAPQSKFSKERIKELLKQPKNIFILAGTAIFVLIVVFKLFSSKPKEAAVKPSEDVLPPPSGIEQVSALPQAPQAIPEQPAPQIVQAPVAPTLPDLDISILDNISSKITEAKPDEEDAVNSLDINKLKSQIDQSLVAEEPEIDLNAEPEVKLEDTQKVTRVRKADPDNPPPPLFDGTKVPAAVDKTRKKDISDFIFIDSSLDAEMSSDVPNEGKKIPDMGNMVAQGRIIDAVLETAIDSSIPGNIRGIVSRDVYAEAGRNILIPKGTRLYGTYSAGGGKAGRVVITWSRLIRPDGISVGIDSYASDQFGRSGIAGDVDKKFGELIASALLLSSIPLVATIATQQITGREANQSVTSVNSSGVTITSPNDPINNATERFSNDISKATEQVVKNLIDTTTVVSIAQGTKIKVMVNQDIKLPRYKAIRALNTTVTSSTQ